MAPTIDIESVFKDPGSSPYWRTTPASPHTYHYLSFPASNPAKPTLFLLHGFPTSPYCFRHAFNPLLEAGYGIIAPEMLGYGNTSAPTDTKEYGPKNLSAGLKQILENEGVKKAVVVGHDHGAYAAQRFVNFHPEHVSALCLLNVGYMAPSSETLDPVKMKQLLGYVPSAYMPFFASEESAQIITEHLESFLSLVFAKDALAVWRKHLCGDGFLEAFLLEDKKVEVADFTTPEDIDYFRALLEDGKITAPTLWYRAIVSGVSSAQEEELADRKHIKVPVLYIGTSQDAACVPAMFAGQKEWIADLTSKEYDATHWTVEEKPKEFCEDLLAWLAEKGL